ncbi:Rhamnogalacturonate lyase, partial [Bienertia sinuspersici]
QRPRKEDHKSSNGVTLNVTDTEVVLDNGLVRITIANPQGYLVGVSYGGVHNVLEAVNSESNRGYWDVVWETKGFDGTDWILGSTFNVIEENENQVEVSFTYKWDSTTWNSSNSYWRLPANVDRRYIMLRGSSGFYAYAILEREEDMPAANIYQIRTVDDKYQYSCEDKDNKLHGWISFDPQIGFWIITPSNEFRSAGPVKQDLTSHMFHSAHYAGYDVTMSFQKGEPWKKVFGPYYVYLNSVPLETDFHELWNDAKHQGYQFWTRADRYGGFMIKGVHEGVYNLYAWVPGFIGDYMYTENITITPGCTINIGTIKYVPPRNGPTLWHIGFPDRTALEFYVPQPSTLFVNKLYTDSNLNKFRQYGLWERYAELYPENDLVYTVGESDYHTDWFFAQVTRKVGNNTYRPTTWQIVFRLKAVIPSANYTLRIALASATRSELHVRLNDPELKLPHFATPVIGSDNAIARHGIHGLYRLFTVNVPSEWLNVGNNTIFLKQTRHESPFFGVMYDYIRLEGPPRTS